ncbi:MAG: hypothetical protein ACLSUH_15385, partial [Ruminococcus sp.]
MKDICLFRAYVYICCQTMNGNHDQTAALLFLRREFPMGEKVINAALLGLGTVGTGVYKVLK